MLNKNNEQKWFGIKFKNTTGSAMSLVIVVMAMLLIFAPYMTSQIANQFRSTRNSYEYIQIKYLAEAGIERSIAEIEEQIKSKDTKHNAIEYSNTTHHPNDNCPKVEFDEKGVPNWGTHAGAQNSFYKLIWYEILQMKSGLIFNTVLFQNTIWIFDEDTTLLDYYNKNIYGLMTGMLISNDINELRLLQGNLKKFIEMMEEAIDVIDAVEESDATKQQKKQAIDGYNEMIGYMKEIQCRLGMDSTGGGDETIEDKEIEVPYYYVTIDDDDKLRFEEDMSKKQEYIIQIEKRNKEVTSIKFKEKNNNLIKDQIAIGAKAADYEMRAEIEFNYAYNDKVDPIKQNVNSYNRIN